jgi:dipeptidyl aminopeptidase/acylaminoacyl peptidase
VAWVDRRGDGGLLDVPENLYGVLDLAADDRTLAVQVSDVRDYVWIWDAENGGRALPARESVGWPVWSPDGRSLAVSSWTAEGTEVVICDLDGQVTQRVLPVGIEVRTPDSWPQPDRVAFTVIAPSGVGVVNPLLPGAPVWVRHDATGVPLGTFAAALSPDARWIAYSSTEGIGEYEVWIQEIDGGIRRQLSTDGGLEPVWCRKCDEVFYRQGNRILARRVTVEPELAIGRSELAFEAPDFVDTKGISFRVSSDGQRMYYVRRSQPPVRDRVHIVHHWFDELERRLPVN